MTSTVTMCDQRELKVDCSIDLQCTAGAVEQWAPRSLQDTFRAFQHRSRMQDTAANKADPVTITFYTKKGWKEQVTDSCSNFFYNNQDPNRPDTCHIHSTSMGNQTLFNKDCGIKIMGSFADGSEFGLYFWPSIMVVQPGSGGLNYANS